MANLIVRVTTIDEIKAHPNAARLDLAIVGGWQCVVGKDNWKAGDRCVYFPPDCMLPEERCKEFEVENYVSRSNRFPGMGRIRCTKFRGEPSFGLCVPVPAGMPDDMWEDCAEWFSAAKYEPPARVQQMGRKLYGHVDEPDTIICSRCVPDGEDHRDYNEIQKRERRGLTCSVCGYTPPVASYAASEVSGFPKYTDIQNLRHYPDLFNEGEEIIVTEKIHGANCRVGVVLVGHTPLAGLPIYEEMAGSHNVRRSDPADNADDPSQAHRSDTYWFPWTLEGVKRMMTELAPQHNSVVLYGEVYGPGIQSLDYGIDGLGFRAFDLKINGKYLPWWEFVGMCNRFDVTTVPYMDTFWWKGPSDLARAKEYATGPAFQGDHIREGVVLRPRIERMDPKVGRVVLKMVSDEYLVSKHHEEEVSDDSEPEAADSHFS